MKRRPMTDYPQHIASLSRDYYHRKISTTAYRAERRRLIEEMENTFNLGSKTAAPLASESGNEGNNQQPEISFDHT